MTWTTILTECIMIYWIIWASKAQTNWELDFLKVNLFTAHQLAIWHLISQLRWQLPLEGKPMVWNRISQSLPLEGKGDRVSGGWGVKCLLINSNYDMNTNFSGVYRNMLNHFDSPTFWALIFLSTHQPAVFHLISQLRWQLPLKGKPMECEIIFPSVFPLRGRGRASGGWGVKY